MLATCGDYRYYALTQEDLDLFDRLLPYDHPLQDLFNLIDWERLAGGLQPYFSDKRGCPSLPPILWLKLEYLRCHYRLSDREVCDRASTDIAFRWYLQLPFRCDPPSASGLCRFRSRLGLEGYQSVFDEVVRLARAQGLIQDRMRLKDASHVQACDAIPVAVQLLLLLHRRALLRHRRLVGKMPVLALTTGTGRYCKIWHIVISSKVPLLPSTGAKLSACLGRMPEVGASGQLCCRASRWGCTKPKRRPSSARYAPHW